MGSPRALPTHTPLYATSRPAGSGRPRSVHLGAAFPLHNTQAGSPPPDAPESLPTGEQHPRYDPAFYQEASTPSTVLWAIYTVAVLVACALFFIFP